MNENNVGRMLKPGTIKLLLEGILEVRKKYPSVKDIAKAMDLSCSTIYYYFHKFSNDTGIPISVLLYQPHVKRDSVKPRIVKGGIRHRVVRGKKPAVKRKLYFAYDLQNFNLSMVEEYLKSPNAEDCMDGATLLIETISKIAEVYA